MAEDRIDSIIDLASIQKEIDRVNELAGELATTLKSMPKARIQVENATNDKEINAALKQQKIDLNDLKIKNAELTVAIKERNLAAKVAADRAKDLAKAAKEQAEAEKELAKNAQIAGQEKIRALQAQKKAEEDLIETQKKRRETDIGPYEIPAGSGQSGGAKLNKPVVKEASFVPANETEENLLFLTKTETALKANQATQKDLGEQLKLNKISQEEYNAAIVKARAEELEYKKQIQLTNAELKARTNADFAIQGSIDAARAQNAILIPQRNAIAAKEGIATPEDIAKIKELNAEIDRNNELIDKNNDLLGRQKINIGNYPNAFGGAFKTLNTELEKVEGKLVSGNFKGAAFDELTAKANVLRNAVSLTGKEFATTAAQATAHKEAAIQIGQVYGKDSEVFKNYSSEVKNGVVANQNLAKEVSNVAVKGKGAANVFQSMFTGLRKLAYLIPGLGISGLVLLLLGPLQAAGAAIVRSVKKGMESIGELSAEAKKKIEELAKANKLVNEEYIKTSTASITKLEMLRKVITDTTRTEKERLAALHDYNKIADDNNKIDDKQLNNLNLINDSIARQIDLIQKRGLAAASEKIVTDAGVKLLLAQNKAEEDARKQQLIEDKYNIQTVEGEKTDEYFKTLNREGAIRVKIAKDAAVKQAQAEFDAAKQIALKNLGINGYVGDPDPTKKGKERIARSQKDMENLLDQFRKKDLESLAKFSNDQLEILKGMYKGIAGDEFASLQERLDAEKHYYDISLQQAENNKKAQEDALNLEVTTGNRKASKIKDLKLRADTEAAIEKYRVDKLKEINQTFENESTKLNQDFYNRNVGIAESSYEKLKKAAEDASKFIQAQQKIAFQNQKDTVGIEKSNQLLQLEKDYQNGSIKSLEEYNQKKEAIETAAAIKEKQLDLKRLQDSEKIFELLYGMKNINFIRQIKDLEVEIEEAGNKKILESQKDLAEKKKEFANDLVDFIESGLLASNQKQQDQLEEQSKNIDERSQREIDAINASGMAEEEKIRRTTAIEKQAAFQHEQIQKKQEQLDKQRRVIERLAAVAEVGAGIVKSVFDLTTKAALARAQAALLLSNPLTAGYAPIAFGAAATISAQIPFVLGAGALALIKAAAFKDGTDNAPKGPALVSEEGPELMVDKSGRMFLTPQKPSLVNLMGGEKIFPADQTEKILSHYNLLNILQRANNANKPVQIDKEIERKMLRVMQNIERKSGVTIINNTPVESTAYYMQNIKN